MDNEVDNSQTFDKLTKDKQSLAKLSLKQKPTIKPNILVLLKNYLSV